MKNPFSNKNSTLMLVLMLLILLLSVRSGKYTYLVNILFFAVLFFYYRTFLTSHALKYFVVIIFLTFWGLIHGNNFISIMEDLLGLSPFILLFIEKKTIKDDLRSRLPQFLANALPYLIPISILIFIYMDYGIGSMQTERFNYDTGTKMALFAPILPILFAPTLLFFFDIYNRREKNLVHLSIILIGLMGIITLSKSVVMAAFLPYLIFYGFKTLRFSFRPLFKLLIILFVISFAIFKSGIIEKINLSIAIEGIVERTVLQNEENRITSSRFEETEAYFNQNLGLLEYIFGRGMGGHKVRKNSDPYIGGINMMHFGPAHAFLKGGILLVSVLYLPLFFAIFKFWKTPNYPISLILLLFFLGNIQTSNWGWGIGMLFYWYGISLYFTSEQKIKSADKSRYAI